MLGFKLKRCHYHPGPAKVEIELEMDLLFCHSASCIFDDNTALSLLTFETTLPFMD